MNKSYYAIIPANVRYDKELTDGAKLLYGEITALCNEKGYCWAGDSYFTDLYGVSRSTIQRWFNQLEKQGYINRKIKYEEGTRKIEHRYTYICDNPIPKNETTPMLKNETDNNTSINNTINNTDIYIGELFDYWNQQNIIKHRSLTAKAKTYINARLKDYSIEELKSAISNYQVVLTDDKYYWTHKWSLQDFMKPNNVTRFVDEAEPLNNFLSSKKGGANNARNDDAKAIAEQYNLPF